MRNKILGNVDAVLGALERGPLTREELKAVLGDIGEDALTNLLLDLVEMDFLEKTDSGYRIGMRLAMVWRRALDQERLEMAKIYGRVKALTGEPALDSDVEKSRAEWANRTRKPTTD